MKGWSASNLTYTRFFVLHCPDRQFGQQAADQLPWFHVVTLLTKLDSPAEREWYAQQTVLQGWSRSTLELNIKSRLQQRQGSAVTNFVSRLPAADSALAQETLKDPYLFDFLGLGHDAQEREIESGLIRHNEASVRELGDEILAKIAHELTASLRANVSVDWSSRESVRAQTAHLGAADSA